MASRAMPTIEVIKDWDSDELLEWIQQYRPKLLKGDTLEKFKEADITGGVFVDLAGNIEFFKNTCNLPSGTSFGLANLAREIAGGETPGMVQKGKEQDTSTYPETRKRKSSPYADIAPLPKRTRVGNSSLIINGELKHFRSGSKDFPTLLRKEGQAYFDRTRYISKLNELDDFILFCRPRRFGKTLTVSLLEHFHGLQYVGEHQSLYKGLDVQNDIDKGRVTPGQFFVLKFDFSKINPKPNRTEANEELIVFLNYSLKSFYSEYTKYLGENVADLCQNIDSNRPNISLEQCSRLVRHAIQRDKQLVGIKGIYVLIDEYDALPNNYLEPPGTVGGSEIAWGNTAVGRTFRSFWTTVKSLGSDGLIPRIFITGISPLSLSSLSSGFNVTTNLSFEKDLAGLCGLTSSDLEEALTQIYKDTEACKGFLSEMTKRFNGYHFCQDKKVDTVYNTETCLAYLQSRIRGSEPQTLDPENSEVSQEFLRMFATSPSVIRDFEMALRCDENDDFMAIKYDQFKLGFTLQDLNEAKDISSWRSLIIYFGGLTFDPTQPKTHLKIPNGVAADRIVDAVLRKYDIRSSLSEALQYLVREGELEKTLGVYQGLMRQRDVTYNDLTQTTEANHRDCFYFCLLKNPYLTPCAEFKVIERGKPNHRRIDLVFQVSDWLVVTEWKFYRVNYLKVEGVDDADEIAKAAKLLYYKLPEILRLEFNEKDTHHKGTIQSQVMKYDAPQLRGYVTSGHVRQLKERLKRKLRAHLVLIVGSRHILLWNMDEEGTLDKEPRLIETPRRVAMMNGG